MNRINLEQHVPPALREEFIARRWSRADEASPILGLIAIYAFLMLSVPGWRNDFEVLFSTVHLILEQRHLGCTPATQGFQFLHQAWCFMRDHPNIQGWELIQAWRITEPRYNIPSPASATSRSWVVVRHDMAPYQHALSQLHTNITSAHAAASHWAPHDTPIQVGEEVLSAMAATLQDGLAILASIPQTPSEVDEADMDERLGQTAD